MLAFEAPNEGKEPAPALGPAAPGASIDARNGFTTPALVACGRSPTPSEEPVPVLVGKPVGCALRPKLPPKPPPPAPAGLDAPFSGADVVGVDCGIGGRLSISVAPNDDVGLNALIPAV